MKTRRKTPPQCCVLIFLLFLSTTLTSAQSTSTVTSTAVGSTVQSTSTTGAPTVTSTAVGSTVQSTSTTGAPTVTSTAVGSTVQSTTDSTTVTSTDMDTTDQTTVVVTTTPIPTVEAPTNLTITDYDTTSITVSWDHEDGSVTDHYIINATCIETDTSTCDDSDSDEITDKEGTVSVLTPGANYNIIVTAYHNNGQPTESDETETQRTKPNKIDIITVDDIGTDVVNISWSKPNDVFTSYNISCDGDSNYQSITDESDKVTYQCDMLTPGKEYIISVVVISNDMPSDETRKTVRTKPNKIDIITVDGIGTDVVNISWSKPNDVFTSYNISCDGDSNYQSITDESDKVTYQCDMLTPGKEYISSVVVISNDMPSDETRKTVRTKPNKIDIITVDGIGTDVVNISWSKPNDVFTSYNISCDGDSNYQSITDESDKVTYQCDMLTPGKEYIISVVVISNDMPSDETRKTVRTKPNKIDIITVDGIGTDVVNISWSKPNDVFTSYNISCDGDSNYQSITDESDKVTYQCDMLTPGKEYIISVVVISNDMPSDETRKTVRTKPNKIDIITVDGIGTDVVNISWSKPNDVFTSYNISCDGDSNYQSITDESDKVTYQCDMLTPGKEYIISVVVISNDMPSDETRKTVRTKPNKIDIITVDSIGTDVVNISWSKPNDVFTSYNISCDGDSNYQSITDESDKVTYQCDMLTPGKEYIISVVVISNDMPSDETRKIVRTKPNKIDIITVDGIGTDVVNISWSKPNDVFTSYNISCDGDSNYQSITDESDKVTYQCDMLTPGKEYIISVVVISNDMPSDETRQTVRTKPVAVTISPITTYNTTSITVEWTIDINTVYDKFEIKYLAGSDGSVEKSKDVIDETQTGDVLTDLVAGESYTIYMITHSGDESSENSTTVTQSTGKSETNNENFRLAKCSPLEIFKVP
ncbi:fibronectin-like [Glandiceps talaboti]